MKKQDKRNWPKAVIQILSFLLIPGLFEAQFSAVGTIISAVYQGTVSWERIRYSVWMVLATVPAVIIVGRFFCGYFCSFGAVQDFLWFAGNKLKKRFRKAGAKNLHSNSKKSGRNVPTGWIKYGVLLFWAVYIVGASLLKKVYNEIGDKYERRRKNYKKYYKENKRI